MRRSEVYFLRVKLSKLKKHGRRCVCVCVCVGGWGGGGGSERE